MAAQVCSFHDWFYWYKRTYKSANTDEECKVALLCVRAQFRKKQVLQEVCAMVASLREAVDR